MAWVIANPQIYNTFASLGGQRGDTYIVNEDCVGILEEILRNLIIEDPTLRTYRRAIGFGENIRKDLIPLLVHVKNSTTIEEAAKIIDATVKILLNLTIPVECLLSLEQESRTDVGRHTIFELNRLLFTSKEAFTDSRSTKAVVDHIKYIIEKDSALTVEQCDTVNNCLLLLRNILHIPENHLIISNSPQACLSMQNQVVWNLFTQSIDKIMIYLITCSQKIHWTMTMVQLIALMYKDQYVGTLQKLLSLYWFEASLSESSDDNESNTSPQNQLSGESSATMISDPTSDSSDNGGSGKEKNLDRNKNSSFITERNINNPEDNTSKGTNEGVITPHCRARTFIGINRGKSTETDTSTNSGESPSVDSGISSHNESTKNQAVILLNKSEQVFHALKQEVIIIKHSKKYICKYSQNEFMDCGYITQTENIRGESISTSSNDDDQPQPKPIHQKLQKIRAKNIRTSTILEKKELRRKKLVKRSKTNIINMKGLMHHAPSDEDITNILKEFTVDFLLKGYGTLVHDLYVQLLTNNGHFAIAIDTSHFFWLVTYFLKFAVQLELDLDLISPVVSYDIMSYLVFQGVSVYEELEIGCNKFTDMDLKPTLRRLHLVVTSIMEFLQALEAYQKITHLNEGDRNNLINLQQHLTEMEELKYLFILLLRQYNPNLQSKQYLQDLIVTNHNYLLLLEQTSTSTVNLKHNMMDHLKEFATIEIMRQYGILLENFQDNGEFVNNCILTMMHHTAGDLDNINTLLQPNILKTFSQIWEADYQLCDDWSDLIEYVINKFVTISKSSPQIDSNVAPPTPIVNVYGGNLSTPGVASQISLEVEWTQEENCYPKTFADTIQDVENTISNALKNYDENYIANKNQNEIFKEMLEMNEGNQKMLESPVTNHEFHDSPMVECESSINDDIKVLKGHLIKEKKHKVILWLQKTLIDACYAKLVVENSTVCPDLITLVEPITYYFTLLNLPIPLIPWTSEQCSIIKHQPFVLLLHKFGFIYPGDVGKIFIRIPNFWSSDYLFTIAEQLGPIDMEQIKMKLYSTAKKLYKSTTHNKENINDDGESLLTTKPTVMKQAMENGKRDLPLQSETYLQRSGIASTDESLLEMDCSSMTGADEIVSETASIVSNLTQMCVSDEEDKTVRH